MSFGIKTQDEVLRATAEVMEPKNWPSIAESLPGRTARECKRRWGHLQRNGEGKIRTPWSKEVKSHICHRSKKILILVFQIQNLTGG